MMLAAASIWGASLAFTKTLVSELSPVTLIAMRCLLGAAVMFFLSGPLGWLKKLSAREWLLLAACGLSGVLATQLLQAWALTRTSANHAGWLMGFGPVVIAAMSALFLGERIGRLRWLGFAVGFAGTLMVIFSSQRDAGGAVIPTGTGDLVFLGGSFSWAAYVLLVSAMGNVPQTGVTYMNMAMSFAALAPVALLRGGAGEVARLSAHGWWALAYMGLLSSGLGYYLWNTGVRRLGASSSGSFLYAEPFAAQFAAAWFLGERLSPYAILGGLVILCGVYWVNGGRAGAGPLKRIYCMVAE